MLVLQATNAGVRRPGYKATVSPPDLMIVLLSVSIVQRHRVPPYALPGLPHVAKGTQAKTSLWSPPPTG